MSSLFNSVLNMSITGSVVIAAVIIVRLLMKKLPKKYAYMLWSVVGFRLCIPFSFKGFISIFQFNPIKEQTGYITDGLRMSYVPAVEAPSDHVQNFAPPTTIAADAVDKVTLSDVLPYIWFAVMVLMLIYGAVSYFLIKNKLSTAVKYRDNIYQSDRILSPFILGIFKPKIYIPFGVHDEYLSYIIAHESCHLKRRDNVIKLFAFILLCVHWYNPFCWLAFYLMNKDMEMSCDERVIKDNADIKKIYSFALLSFAADNKIPSPASLCFGEGSVKGRIKNVLSFKKPKAAVSAIAVNLCVIVLVACAANPIENKKIASTAIENGGYTAYAIGDFVAEQGSLSAVGLGNKGYVYISDNGMVAYNSQLGNGSIPSYYSSGWKLSGDFTEDELNKYLENNVCMPVKDDWTLPKFEAATVIDYFDALYSSTPSYSIYVLDNEPYMINYASRYFLLNYDETENEKLSDDNYVANLMLLQEDTRKYIDSLFNNITHPDDEAVNASSNPGDYVRYNQVGYDELVSGNIYTLQYIFEEFEKGGQTDLKGHIMRLVLDDIIGSEALKLSASTGQEYYDAWTQSVRDIFENSTDDLSEFNPYGSFYYSLYGGSSNGNHNSKYVNSSFVPFECTGDEFIINRYDDIKNYDFENELLLLNDNIYNYGRTYSTNDFNKFDFDAACIAYIDGALFFRNTENNQIYRVAVDLERETSDEPTLVWSMGYARICKVEKNSMILYNSDTDVYYSLNTKTGATEKAMYNYAVDTSNGLPDGVTITAQQAIEWAKREAADIHHYNTAAKQAAIGYEMPEPFEQVTVCKLVCDIDFYRYADYDAGFVGDMPHYAWLIELENNKFNAAVIVGAAENNLNGCRVELTNEAAKEYLKYSSGR